MRTLLLRSHAPVSLLLALALGLAACGGDGGTDAGTDSGGPQDAGMDAGGMCTEFSPEYCPRDYPDDPIPIDRVCEAFADAFCRANGNCCMREDEIYDSFDACLTEQLSRCSQIETGFEYRDQVLVDMTINYNASAVGNALDRLGPAADACEAVRFGDVILEAMEGRLSSGDACSIDVECEDTYTCRLDALGESTVCRGDRREGDDCENDGDCAFYGGFCDTTCQPQRALDETCERDEQCESLMCLDGVCAELTGENAYCVRIGEPGRAFER